MKYYIAGTKILDGKSWYKSFDVLVSDGMIHCEELTASLVWMKSQKPLSMTI